jgi:hypothetical protein
MAVSVQSVDNSSHAVLAIATLADGRKVKFPKVKASGSSWASDAAWQAAYQTELANAANQAQVGNAPNATAYLASIA